MKELMKLFQGVEYERIDGIVFRGQSMKELMEFQGVEYERIDEIVSGGRVRKN